MPSADVKRLHQQAADKILEELGGIELSQPPQIRIIKGRTHSVPTAMLAPGCQVR